MNVPNLNAFILAHRTDNVATLALHHAKTLPPDTLQYALRQIEGWQRLRLKAPTWAATGGIQFPSRLSLEQCSGEAAARHKAAVVERLVEERRSMADLTGGMGVDFAALAPLFATAIYVERSAELARLAAHNLPLVGAAHAIVRCAEAAEALADLPHQSLIFIDPARRDTDGRKTVLLQDCTPCVTDLIPLLREKTDWLLLKLSPMLDLRAALTSLPPAAEAHVVAEGGECKELLLAVPMKTVERDSVAKETVVVCQDNTSFSFTLAEERHAAAAYAPAPLHYLYEPSAAVLKAGPLKLLCQHFGVQKLHPNTHLYTSATLVPDFPGRSFEVVATCGLSKPEVRQLKADVPQANITVRNFPLSVAQLRQRLRLPEGGSTYLFAATLADGSKRIIVCRKA